VKILYFSNEDVPADHAGAVHTWEVARGLARRGHTVTLVSAAASGLYRRERREGVTIYRARSRLGGVKSNLRAAWLLPALARRSWDVVMERYLTLNGLGFLFAAARGLPYFVEVNGPHLEEIIYRWDVGGTRRARVLRWWVDRQFARADGACAPNVNIIRPVARGVAHKIIWGVNENQFGAALRESPEAVAFRRRYAPEDAFVVVFVGSFRPWQGTRELPAIIARTVARVPAATFWLIGGGDEREAVATEAARAGLGNAVRFPGWRPHGELPYILAAADAAVAPFNDAYYPPLREFGFYWAPTKVLESLASGVAVVTARYPVLDEIVVEGKSGYLVPPGDADAYAAALARLAADDQSARAARAAYAEEDVKSRFSWTRHCELLEGFLAQAIERRKGLRRR
jgi:glycosyltransferase involved in cell wall biosynthesis